MSFPASFGSQLTAVMEALLKAVVAEVTALVEDGAVELRLELRDRDREIREKQREIEQRDRHILDLRAAVEELRGREEAAVSPGEERPEQTESCSQQVWTKENDPEPVVKCEPIEELTDPRRSLWPPPPLPAAARPYDESGAEHAHRPSAYGCEKTEDFAHLDAADLHLDSLQHFYAQLPAFSLMPGLSRARDDGDAGHAKRLSCGGGFRCDQCGKTFTVKWRLVSHQSVHTGAKPFSCAKCGARFSRRDSCVRHEKKACCKDGLLLMQER
ncbi:uncharacterized protein [Eucyclogobius newberryi]|uniref:uncharacterized protein n=1 Tax=Eucyclogobius newberryi TaxID=166745 RepID=UPI003B5BEA80